MESIRQSSNYYAQHHHAILAGIVALLAFSFDCGVNRRFGLMEAELRDASTRTQHDLEMHELIALEYHTEASLMYSENINHTLMAFQSARKAHLLKNNITKVMVEMKHLEEDAEEEKEQAEFDSKEASMWALRAFGDGRASVGAEMTGLELAEQAKEENEKAQNQMESAAQLRAEGTEKLKNAKAALEEADEAKNLTAVDKGICKWLPLACDLVRGHPSSADANVTSLTKPSDLAIQANKDIQVALQEIHDAKAKQDFAMDLFTNASQHANLSTEILRDAQMFRQQSDRDNEMADEYRGKAMKDEEEYQKDESLIKDDSANIWSENQELSQYMNDTRNFIVMALAEYHQARLYYDKLNKEILMVRMVEFQLNNQIKAAKHHVANAGWSALAASVTAACLFVLAMVKIIGTFRYQRPLQWIIRGAPHTCHDTLYLLSHICIFFLTMGYVGELLAAFGQETKLLACAGITIVFALVGTIIQVTLLHLVPHVYMQLQDSSALSWIGFQILLQEDVIKKGVLVSLVLVIELLLLWVISGNAAFEQAYQWNIWWSWIVVMLVAAWYAVYMVVTYGHHHIPSTTNDISRYLDVFDDTQSWGSGGSCIHTTTSRVIPAGASAVIGGMVRENEEHQSLLVVASTSNSSNVCVCSIQDKEDPSVSGSTTRSDVAHALSSSRIVSTSPTYSTNASSSGKQSQSNSSSQHSSSSFSHSMRSVPLVTQSSPEELTRRMSHGYGGDYGALPTATLPSIAQEVQSSLVSPWSIDFRKVQLLFEILVACWSAAVVWRDCILILKLYPMVQGLAWGMCPLWILNIFVLLAVLVLVVECQWKKSTR